ncbi:MAG: SDR family NAD(P)-dependent oxidoreductase [Brevundimonas sp.]|uniref:SDR family NAD(P)-dependent oxidoreductase n=1 Tax=Brevundimonas sp. TaxID=1871086 RepID=UPI003918C803
MTGASTGIGPELALCFAEDGFDLTLAADTPLDEARRIAEALGARVETVQADLATPEGIGAICTTMGARIPDALAANAGHGLGHAFLDQRWDDIRHVIDTNITGTVALLHRLVPAMRDRGEGRILLIGSIAGLIPGSFQAVYNASKAFVDSFSFALRNELKDTGVTVTCLMPGPTDTDFFARADMLDTSVGQSGHKADPAKVARTGYKAMNDGVGDVVAGLGNRMQAALAAVTPQSVLAEQHRKMAEPKR